MPKLSTKRSAIDCIVRSETLPNILLKERAILNAGQLYAFGYLRGLSGFIRKPPKRVDYLLRYTRDFPLAVVEAKAAYKTAADGLQQAKQYAEMLGLKFAYAIARDKLPLNNMNQ